MVVECGTVDVDVVVVVEGGAVDVDVVVVVECGALDVDVADGGVVDVDGVSVVCVVSDGDGEDLCSSLLPRSALSKSIGGLTTALRPMTP